MEEQKYQFEVGDTVTDGWRTYVYDRDLRFHYVGTGCHANFHISTDELKRIVGEL